MFGKKIRITLTSTVILLFSIVSIAYAAPPLQGGKGISQGHALKLDADGNNLGAVVSGNKDQAQTDDGETGDDGQNRVAAALANYFDGASYEEIMALHESGVGFGNIIKGFYFTKKFGLEMGTEDLIAKAHQFGWGKTLRDNGIHPGSIGKGKGQQPEHAGATIDDGQGNGQGKGKGNNGQGIGKGKNKGGSRNDEADVDSDDDDDATDEATADIDNDDDNGNGNSRGKGKGNNGQGKGHGKEKGKGKGNGNGNNGQGNATDGDNAEEGSDGN